MNYTCRQVFIKVRLLKSYIMSVLKTKFLPPTHETPNSTKIQINKAFGVIWSLGDLVAHSIFDYFKKPNPSIYFYICICIKTPSFGS